MEAAMLRLCTTVLFISVVTRVTGAGVAGLFVARREVTEVQICGESAPEGLYRLQHSVALSGADWRDVGAPVAGTGGRACVGDGVSVGQGFYRVSQVGGGLDGAALTASIQISEVRQCWETATNLMYQLQERSELSGNGWTDVGAPRVALEPTTCERLRVIDPRREYRLVGPEVVWIGAGTFTMGSLDSEPAAPMQLKLFVLSIKNLAAAEQKNPGPE